MDRNSICSDIGERALYLTAAEMTQLIEYVLSREAAEREACAVVLVEESQKDWSYKLDLSPQEYHSGSHVLDRAAAAIRARGEEEK